LKDQRHGYGIFYYGDGELKGGRYEGNWYCDMRQGMGTVYDKFNRKQF
jgi:hypothetical protein